MPITTVNVSCGLVSRAMQLLFCRKIRRFPHPAVCPHPQSGDLASHDERLDGDLRRVGLLAAEKSHATRFLQSLDLDRANGPGDLLGRARLGGLEIFLVAGCESVVSASRP